MRVEFFSSSVGKMCNAASGRTKWTVHLCNAALKIHRITLYKFDMAVSHGIFQPSSAVLNTYVTGYSLIDSEVMR